MNDPMLEKIRKLLATAEHPGTPPEEADTAMSMAQKLITKHAIDRALLDRPNIDRSKVEARIIRVENPYGTLKCNLLFSVARTARCKAVRSHSPIDGGYRMTVVGFPTDLDACEMTYTSLLLQLVNAARMCGNTDKNWYRGMSTAYIRSFRSSFIAGWTTEVGNRLRLAAQTGEKEAVKEHGTSVALVLVDRSTMVDDRFKEMFPRTGSVKSGTIRNGAAFGAGRRSGATADIGGTRLGGSRATLGR